MSQISPSHRDIRMIRDHLDNATGGGEMAGAERSQKQEWVRGALAHVDYDHLSREDRGLVRQYLHLVTGYSRAQVERHIAHYRKESPPMPVTVSEIPAVPVFADAPVLVPHTRTARWPMVTLVASVLLLFGLMRGSSMTGSVVLPLAPRAVPLRTATATQESVQPRILIASQNTSSASSTLPEWIGSPAPVGSSAARIADRREARTKTAVHSAPTSTEYRTQLVASIAGIGGKPTDGQIVIYRNGKAVWGDLPSDILRVSDDGRASGTGRKPMPQGGGQLHESAPSGSGGGGGSRGGGGGGGSGGGGSTTNITYVTNNTTTGLSLTDADARYVNVPGDTMTGGLLIQLGNPASTIDVNLLLEVAGSMSGRLIHAQDALNSSGTLLVEGASTFESTVRLSGVTYTFPYGDGSASGKVLKTDGAGNLSWSADNNSGGGSSNFSSGNVITLTSRRYIDAAGDTMTGALTILKAAGSATGNILIVDTKGLIYDGTNKRVGIVKLAPATALDVVGTISGSSLQASALPSCTNLQTGVAGAFACNNALYLATSTGSLKTLFDANYLRTSTGSLKVLFDANYFRTSTGSLKAYLRTLDEARYVNTSGDTMTGTLTARSITASGVLTLTRPVGTGTGNILAIDTKGLIYDGTNKRVGIGITPTYLLHVKDAITTTGQPADLGIILEDSQGTPRRGGFYMGGGDDFVVGAASNHALNIGQNDIARIALPVVSGDNSYSPKINFLTNGDQLPIFFKTTGGTFLGVIKQDTGGNFVYGTSQAGGHYFYTGANGSSTEGTARMTVLSNGNVGIGTTAPGLRLEVTGSGSFGSRLAVGTTYADTALEVIGTASGSKIIALDQLRSSGSLSVQGATVLKGAVTLNSTLRIGGVTYTFPYGDGSASGKVLKTDGAGNLSWSADNNSGGGSSNFSSGNVITLTSRRYIDAAGDTMTGALSILKTAGSSTGNTLIVDTKGLIYDATNKRVGIGTTAPDAALEIIGTASGTQIHALDQLRSSGSLSVQGTTTLKNDLILGGGNINFTETTAIGDGGDAITINSNGTLTVDDILSVQDNNITNVGDIALDTISSDAGTTIGITLGTDAGDDLLIDTNVLVVEGDNNRVGILTTAPDTALEIIGTASGSQIIALDQLRSSGSLSVQGATILKGAVTLNSTLRIGGVTYTFPYGDGSASGKVIKTDGAGNLSWSADNNSGGGSSNFSSGNVITLTSRRYIDAAGDTMTGALTILKAAGSATGNTLIVDTKGLIYDATNKRVGIGTAAPDTALEIIGTASGSQIVALDQLRSSGSLSVQGVTTLKGATTLNSTLNVTGNATFDTTTLFVDSSGDKVGIGTTTPDTALEIIGTTSGSKIIALDQLRSSGSLSVQGATTLKGVVTLLSTLRIGGVTYTFPYGDGSASGKVLKTDGAGNLSWSADATSATSYTAAQGLTLNGTAFKLNATISGSLVRFLTLSGSDVFAKNSLFSSGSLSVEGKTTLQNIVNIASGSLTISRPVGTGTGNILAIDTKGLIYDATNKRVGIMKLAPATALDVVGTISGTTLNISGLNGCTNLQTSATGLVSCNGTTYLTTIGAGQGLTLIGTSALKLSASISGTTLNFATVSGSVFTARNSLVSSGTLMIAGTTTLKQNVTVSGSTTLNRKVGTGTGNILIVDTKGLVYDATNKRVGIGTAAPDASLEIIGTASGSQIIALDQLRSSGSLSVQGNTLLKGTATVNGAATVRGTLSGAALVVMGQGTSSYILGNLGLGTANTAKTKLEVLGSMSGSSLTITSLKSCDTIDTDLNGALVCGSDATAASPVFGSGNVFTLTNSRYVNTGGDTMTGALSILKTAGTGTGNTLIVDTKGLIYDATNKRVGIGTAAPDTALEIIGTASGSQIIALDQLRSSGSLSVQGATTLKNDLILGGGNINFTEGTTIGDGGDALIINSNGTLTVQDILDVSDNAITNVGDIALDTISSDAGTTIGITLGTDAGDDLLIDTNVLVVEGDNNRVGILTTAPDTELEIIGTTSGSKIIALDQLRSSGSLSIQGNTLLKGTATVNGAATVRGSLSGAALQIMGQGTASYILGNFGVGTANTAKTKLEVLGTISGSALTVSGLSAANCDVKSTNGVLSCGTDATGESSTGFGQGLSIANSIVTLNSTISGSLVRFLTVSGSNIYAKNSLFGSGTLSVEGKTTLQNTVTVASGSLTILRPVGTGTGNLLTIDTKGLVYNGTNTRVGIGTATPRTKLEVTGAMSGNSLYIARAFSGAGLSGCWGTANKLVWSGSTQQFGCQADQGGGGITVKVKTANETVNNSATLQNDDHLNFAIGASENWAFTMDLAVDNEDGTTGFKMAMTAPSGARCVTMGKDGNSTTPSIIVGCGVESANLSGLMGGYQTKRVFGSVRNSTNAGTVQLQWAQFSAGAFNTTVFSGSTLLAFKTVGSDLAEIYASHEFLIPGTVVTLDSTLPVGVQASTTAYDPHLMGVVSTQPGLVIGEPVTEGTMVFLALAGRVPVLVSTENGPIQPGDYLTSSSQKGVAMRATKPGMVVGQAMEPYDEEGIGVVMTFIKNTHMSGFDATNSLLSGTGDTLTVHGNLTVTGALLVHGGATFGSLVTIDSATTQSGENLFAITSNVHGTGDTVFRVNAGGDVYADGAFTGGGADYAEWFETAETNMQFGQAVCIDVENERSVHGCTIPGDPNIIGLVSSQKQAAFIGNKFLETEKLSNSKKVLVGLLGQLSADVVVEPDPSSDDGDMLTIRPGDPLAAGSIPGTLKKALPGESSVGVALEGLDPSTGLMTNRAMRKVLISPKNRSLTAEAVSDRVLQTIKDLNIENELKLSLQQAMNQLSATSAFMEPISEEVERQLDMLSVASVNDRLAAIETQLVALSGGFVGHLSANAQDMSIESALRARDIAANSITLEESLTAKNGRFTGDFHVDGIFDAYRIYVPHGIQVDGTLKAGSLETQDATVNGALTLNGELNVTKGITFASGSTLTLHDLVVRGALRANAITIDGLAQFFGDVEIKGQLTVSTRQAGFAEIPASGTAVTVLFDAPFTAQPVVNASPGTPVLYAVSRATSTGFTISVAYPVTETVSFSWTALTVADPTVTIGTAIHAAASSDSSSSDEPSSSSSSAESSISSSSEASSVPQEPIAFPVDSRGVPVSTNLAWNSCINNYPLILADGTRINCWRYRNGYVWEHPDLHISFTYNAEKSMLQIPEGYVIVQEGTENTQDASSSSSTSSETSSETSSVSSETSSEASSSSSQNNSESSSSESSEGSSSSESSEASTSSNSSSSESVSSEASETPLTPVDGGVEGQ